MRFMVIVPASKESEAGIRQLGFPESIAGRLDDDDAARRTACGGYTGRDSVGLPQRELAAT